MTTLTELIDDPQRELRIRQRMVAMQFGLQVEKFLEHLKLKRSGLAERLGTSRAWVSKLLYGPRNLRLFTAVEVADALDCDVHLSLVPRQQEIRIAPFPYDVIQRVEVHAAANSNVEPDRARAEARALSAHGAVGPPDPVFPLVITRTKEPIRATG